MRIQIELKRDAVPQVALNKLFKHTALQSTFGVNAVALVNGMPRTLSLLELITHYLDFQREIVTRRSKHELRQKEKRAHILAGLPDRARQPRRGDRADPGGRRHRGGEHRPDGGASSLSEMQASAILELRLRALTALERKGVENEYNDIQERIDDLRDAARRRGEDRRADPGGAARAERDLRPRTTIAAREIVAAEEELELEDLIAEEDMVIAITRSGYIKRLPVTAYREQRRGGDRRDGDGPEGRGLHRAPVRRLDARLHPLLHQRRQGLPPEGARAAARLAPVEGPRDRQPAAVPPRARRCGP